MSRVEASSMAAASQPSQHKELLVAVSHVQAGVQEASLPPLEFLSHSPVGVALQDEIVSHFDHIQLLFLSCGIDHYGTGGEYNAVLICKQT